MLASKKIDYEIAEFSRDHEDARLQDSFADFMRLNAITGRSVAPSQSSILSAEFVVDNKQKIEVLKDETVRPDVDNTPLTILAHRDENDDLRALEVICSCGKHATIALDYEEPKSALSDEDEDQ